MFSLKLNIVFVNIRVSLMDNINVQFPEVLVDLKGAEHSRPSATWGNSSEVRR